MDLRIYGRAIQGTRNYQEDYFENPDGFQEIPGKPGVECVLLGVCHCHLPQWNHKKKQLVTLPNVTGTA